MAQPEKIRRKYKLQVPWWMSVKIDHSKGQIGRGINITRNILHTQHTGIIGISGYPSGS